MPEPYNYNLANVPDPMQSVMAGFKNSFDIRAMADQQKARTMALQDEESKRKRTNDFNNDTYSLYENPTVDGINKLMVKYPEFASKFDKAREGISEEAQRNRVNQASEAFVAAIQGNNDVAKTKLLTQAEAARNAGKEEEAKAAEAMAKTLEKDPKTFVTSAAMYLAQAMGPKDFEKNYKVLLEQGREQDLAPAKLKEQEAKATEAAVKAKFAESKAVSDLNLTQAQIKDYANDYEIAKLNNKVAAANAAISRETNTLKREELGLKVQEMKAARDEKVRTKIAEGNDKLDAVDQPLALVQELMGKDWKEARLQSTGALALRGSVPGTMAKSYSQKVEQLKNMLAIPSLEKMKGAISDKDIVFLKNVAASLDRFQDEGQFYKELGKAKSTLEQGKKRVKDKYGMPSAASKPGQVYEVDF